MASGLVSNVEKHAFDVVVLCVCDVIRFRIMVYEIRAWTSPPTVAIALHSPCHLVVSGRLVGLGDVAASDFRIAVARLVHLLDVNAVVVGFNLLHEDIKSLVIVVYHHFAVNTTRRILSHFFRKFIRKDVTHAGLVEGEGVQNPVVFFWHTENADVVVSDVVSL